MSYTGSTRDWSGDMWEAPTQTVVKVYSSDTCAPCLSLKKYLDHKGVTYKVLDVDLPTHAAAVTKYTGRKVVPVTVIGRDVIIGLNYSAISKALEQL